MKNKNDLKLLKIARKFKSDMQKIVDRSNEVTSITISCSSVNDGKEILLAKRRAGSMPGNAQQPNTAICRIYNKSCDHYGGEGKCALPATGECHEKQQY